MCKLCWMQCCHQIRLALLSLSLPPSASFPPPPPRLCKTDFLHTLKKKLIRLLTHHFTSQTTWPIMMVRREQRVNIGPAISQGGVNETFCYYENTWKLIQHSPIHTRFNATFAYQSLISNVWVHVSGLLKCKYAGCKSWSGINYRLTSTFHKALCENIFPHIYLSDGTKLAVSLTNGFGNELSELWWI